MTLTKLLAIVLVVALSPGCSKSSGGSNSLHVLQSATGPVLLEFWATWCGPCKQLAPVIAEIEKERPSSVIVRKIDIDKNPKIAQQFGVQSIPTMVLVLKGTERGRLVGAVDKNRVLAFIKESLAK